MFQQLQKFHSFKGSYRTVRDYISKRKKELREDYEEAALPLDIHAIEHGYQVSFISMDRLIYDLKSRVRMKYRKNLFKQYNDALPKEEVK